MNNPFRTPVMRRQFEVAVQAYQMKHRDLFTPEGEQRKGSGFATSFWEGFNNTPMGAGYIDRRSKETFAYAYFRAGQACREESDSK